MFNTQQQEAAEITRLERAIASVGAYTLDEIPSCPGVFIVTGGSRAYRTSSTTCTCMDHIHRGGIACKHVQMVRGRLLADGNASQEERRAEAKRMRDLLWD